MRSSGEKLAILAKLKTNKKFLSIAGGAVIAAIGLGAYVSTAFASGPVTIDVYDSIKRCEFSSNSKGMELSCVEVAGQASEYAKKFKWPFKTVDECYRHYSIESCYVDDNGYLNVKPKAFGYIHKNGGMAIPVYSPASASGAMVLPNGYKTKMGRSQLVSGLNDEDIKNLFRPKTLDQSACAEIKGKKVCAPRIKLISAPAHLLEDALRGIAKDKS